MKLKKVVLINKQHKDAAIVNRNYLTPHCKIEQILWTSWNQFDKMWPFTLLLDQGFPTFSRSRTTWAPVLSMCTTYSRTTILIELWFIQKN